MSQQIQISGGAKVRDLQDVIIGTSGVLSSLAFNVANGVPKLDVNGKILVSQLPNSVMEYKGVWNAATNSPTLTNGGAFNQGDVYLCDTAGTVNFGAGPIAFVVGDQVIYSGSIWQRASGATGTVTSVAVTESGDSLNITGSPITTSGTINIGFNGTNLQYVNGAGNLTTFPTLITSIGLSMPSAFSVANSPLTANGTIAVTGAGYASQYIRGDGTLADFPSSGGGGSSVSYYLNGGTSQGTIGGVTYYEMSKTADTGTGVDFTKTGDGFIVAFLTDANDPAQLNIPAGNWNYEIYASMSANGGTPQMYAELYKYDGTTFTLISTSTNEILYDGTNLNLYTFGMTVPATTLALTDRLAIKLYATNSGGKTTTIHTQDSHLCQVITTFSTGITALNGLTAQVQYFQTGTSGTDFNISSTTATHTFNIPDASATARGLITTGTQTIAGTKTFSDATKNNGGIFLQNASSSSLAGYMNLGGLTNGVKFTSGGGVSNTFTLPSATGYTFTFPNATGTIALTSDISYPVTSVFGRTGAVVATSGDYTTAQVTESGNLYFTDSRARLALSFVAGSGAYNSTTGVITIPTNNNQITNGAGYTTNVGTVTSVAATGGTGISITGSPITTSGTITITNTAPDQVVALTASTGISVTGTYPNFTITNTSPSSGGTVTSVAALTIGTTGTDLSSSVATGTTTPVITLNVPTASATNRGALSSADWTTFNNKYNLPSLTSGSVLFSNGSTIAQDNANFFWDDTNNRLGIGTALPTVKLQVIAALNSDVAIFSGSNLTRGLKISTAAGTDNDDIAILNAQASTGSLAFQTASATKMTLSNSGNLGLGVTPSAWSSFRKSMEIGALGNSIAGSTTSGVLELYANSYINTGGNYIYSTTSTAGLYQIDGNAHKWYNAPSGTAGAAITFTQAMTLDANGSLGIGTATMSSGIPLTISAASGLNTNIAFQQNSVNKWFIRNLDSSDDFSFYYAPSSGERLRITSGGNVLIGTSTDSGYKLDVNGTGRFSGTVTGSTSNAFYVNAISGNSYISYGLNGTTNAYTGLAGSAGAIVAGTSTGDLVLRTEGYNMFLGTNSNTSWALKLTASTGAATFSSSVRATSGFIKTALTSGSGPSTPTYENMIDYTEYGISAKIEGGNTFGWNADTYLKLSTSGGNVVIGPTGAATFSSSVTATSFFESSDSRLKTLIQDNYQTKGIASITPKLYTKNGKVELGYYAQDFVGILDSAVSKGSDDMLSLSYREVLVAKVYALEQRIKELENN